VAALQADSALGMATLKEPLDGREDRENPNVVKVVTDSNGNALYFSRAPIPYRREGSSADSYRHVGLYAYRRQALLDFAAAPPSTLEQSEQLEQLRVLEMGGRICVLQARGRSVSVDTPEDLKRAQRLLDDVPN